MRSRRPLPHRRLGWLLSWSLALAAAASEAQWPQWRGPGRDGRAVRPIDLERWPAELELCWRVDVGHGHASPLVTPAGGGGVLLFVRDGDGDRVEARRLADGSPIWHNGYRSPYTPDHSAAEHGRGPFSTPVLIGPGIEAGTGAADRGAGGLLITYSIDQVLTGWRAADGTRVWQRDFGGEFDPSHPVYGNSQSPIVVDGVLVVHAGRPGDGAIFGLDPATGEERWRIPGDGAAYGSFLAAEIAGARQLVGFTQERLVGLDAAAGRILWQTAYDVPYDNTVVTPTVIGDRVIVAAWQTPLRAYRVTRSPEGAWSVEVAWENDEIAIQHASPVVAGGFLYGHSHRNGSQLWAVDPESGRTVWLGPPRQGDEQAVLVAAEPWVLVFRQDGRLEVLRAGERAYRPHAGYRVAEGQVWAHPAVWHDRILVKDRDRLSLWRIPGGGAVDDGCGRPAANPAAGASGRGGDR